MHLNLKLKSNFVENVKIPSSWREMMINYRAYRIPVNNDITNDCVNPGDN